ncbi:hypothetical protein ABZ864_47880 [Streptomyces sp. NPDC047082]|uniref:hypothetical protein n=1 Tax=Streptomyces sp. NPDC047082 TaxID=3155259 RepID=UPI0033CE3AC7
MKTVIIAVVTTLATTFAVSRFAPRLEARSVRIKAAWAARDTFSGHILTILSATARLQNLEPAEAPEPLRSRLQGGQDRWAEQVEESTRYLIDHAEQYVLTYPSRPLDLQQMLTRAVVAARGVWLSELPVEERARRVQALFEPVQGIFFAKRSHRLRHLADDRRRLQELLRSINGPASAGRTPPPAGTAPSA